MNIHDFRRLALSLPDAEESSHMGAADFRVGGRIFATLAAAKLGYGNVMITPDQQAAFVEELPAIFIPVTGGWGRGGATHVNLAVASEDVVFGALQTAHKLRVEKNARTGAKPPATKPKGKLELVRKSQPAKRKRDVQKADRKNNSANAAQRPKKR